MAAGGSALWVTEAAGPRVARIDERSGHVEATLHVGRGAGDGGPVAFGFASLWLGRGPEVLRVDPRSGRVLAHMSTPVDVTSVRAGGGAVWAVSGQEGRIAKIDPATARVVARNRLRGWASDLAAGDGFVWLSVVPGNVVFKLSADDLAVAGTSPAAASPDALAWGGGRLWASSGAGRSLMRAGGEGALAPAAGRDPGRGGRVRRAGLDGHVAHPAARTACRQGWGAAHRDLERLARHRPRHVALPGRRSVAVSDVRAVADLPGRRGRGRSSPRAGDRRQPPAVSADGRTYTFRIRPGYRFSPPPSGAAVTAETFRATIERALSPRLGEESLAALIVDDIVGAAAYHAGARVACADSTCRATGSPSALSGLPATSGAPGNAAVLSRPAGHACRTGRQYFAAAVDRAVLHRVAEPRPRGARAQPELPRARPQRPDRIVYLTGVGADEALRRADKGTVDYVPYDYDAHGLMSVGGPRDRAFGATSAAARRMATSASSPTTRRASTCSR